MKHQIVFTKKDEDTVMYFPYISIWLNYRRLIPVVSGNRTAIACVAIEIHEHYTMTPTYLRRYLSYISLSLAKGPHPYSFDNAKLQFDIVGG